MSRNQGVGDAVREAIAGFEPLFALLTQLGDVWWLVTVSLLLFWLGPSAPLRDWDRRQGLVLVGTALCAIAATLALKEVFALSRPPTPAVTEFGTGVVSGLYESAATASGHGFPSGHAIGSTAVYGTAAVLGARDHRRTRLAVAGLLVAVVSLSRLALGLHFLVDVLAGVGVGMVLVGLARALRNRPRAMLELALLLSLVWVATAGVTSRALTLLGVSAGLWVAWWRYGPSVAGEVLTTREATLTAVLGLVLLGPTLGYAATAVTGGAAFVVAVLGGLGVVALPLALGGEKSES